MASAAFIDGYPFDPTRPDFPIHCILDGELRNGESLRGTLATNGLRYPAYFAASDEERFTWITPALRRAEWNLGREPWISDLSGLINLLLPCWEPGRPRLADDDTLLLLARLGPHLQRAGRELDCYHLDENIARELNGRKEPLSPALLGALDAFVKHLIAVHCHGPSTFDIAWHLWRAPENGNDGEPCFSAAIRREMRFLPARQAKLWAKFWNRRGKGDAAIRQAMEAIGTAAFTTQCGAWMAQTAERQPATMSAAGREVMRHLLQACRTVPELAIDEALYTLCGIRWAGDGNSLLTKEWLGDLLQTLATRPSQRLFACVERLMLNPATQSFPEVQQAYNRLMADMMESAVPPKTDIGVDGFDLNSEPALREQHLALDRHLRHALPTTQKYAWNASGVQTRWMALGVADQPGAFLRALASRRKWIAGHYKPEKVQAFYFGRGELTQADRYLIWHCALDDLLRQLLESSPKLTEAELVVVLESETATPSAASSALFHVLEQHIAKHGYSEPLVQPMTRWHGATHGSMAAMELRHRIGWMLWFEDVTPIRLQDCWSNHVRAGLRSKPPEMRSAWRELLENVSFGTGEKPPRKWLKPATKALQAVGPVEFREALRQWFAPFAAGDPLRLTVVGRDILRNLLFYALLAADPGVDEALAWFAAARWKTKKDQSCVAVTLPAFVHALIARDPELAHRTFQQHPLLLIGKSKQMIEALSERLGRPVPTMATVPQRVMSPKAALDRAMTGLFTGPNTEVEGDRVLVTGVRDSYTLGMRDGSIRRNSDGRPVRLALHQIDDPTIGPMQAMMNAIDGKYPWRPNYLRLKLCADILAHDDANQDLIVADDEV